MRNFNAPLNHEPSAHIKTMLTFGCEQKWLPMKTEILTDGLCFGEGPRWHLGALWLSDMHAHVVYRIDAEGRKTQVVDVPNQPSGLGWLPDGRLLVVSMTDKKILVQNPSGLEVWSDLADLARHDCNDMVVDQTGRAWVGNFGFDLHAGQTPVATELIRVDPNGEATIVAQDLKFPNGSVITPDGQTLIVAESFGAALTAFDFGANHTLTNRRTWAHLGDAVPDGICLDAEGAIWVASPVSNECLRVLEGGAVTHRIAVEDQAFACMLGGEDGCRLFILTAPQGDPEHCKAHRAGKVVFVDVDVPGAGWP
jgi:sugar lactone lactonase YvrE